MKEFYFKLIGKIFQTGKKWDLLSSSKSEVRDFAKKYLNEEPLKHIDGGLSDEYIVVSSGETIGERLRSEQWVDGTIHSIYNTLKKYSTKKDIVVYRGVSKPVFDKMIESAKGDATIDFKEKAFLHTSVVKGCEISDSYRKLRIKVPKGTNAFYAGNINTEESIYYEVVVQKGARLKVISIDDYINCELVGTD
ncbi:TPA: hypothetical protein VH316_001932 [Streptococcus pyogenes]|jgi:hypothetical protein|nr:ADP-ribosyltransferase [Streptococcus salivarius]TKY26883.1 ADP-ribosyltransferase [Streptococcus pyogenes]HER4519549.1 hypothetical protein [Streptococcus pyogenes NGAS749]HEQ6471771.1 hypothetical protein [Streptococcus pyogenes]HEQ6472791.1 hypothetical protein [Streptococcus pyogenes]